MIESDINATEVKLGVTLEVAELISPSLSFTQFIDGNEAICKGDAIIFGVYPSDKKDVCPEDSESSED